MKRPARLALAWLLLLVLFFPAAMIYLTGGLGIAGPERVVVILLGIAGLSGALWLVDSR